MPLVVLFPSMTAAGSIVKSAVSLRDLPATIVELVGLNAGGLSQAGRCRVCGAIPLLRPQKPPVTKSSLNYRVPTRTIPTSVVRPFIGAR